MKVSNDGLLRDMCLTAKRLTPPELLAHGLVDALASEGELLPAALDLARQLVKVAQTPAYGQIKRTLHRRAISALQLGDVPASFESLSSSPSS
jgi:enoyl-CoA hydratase/carnithine racemase